MKTTKTNNPLEEACWFNFLYVCFIFSPYEVKLRNKAVAGGECEECGVQGLRFIRWKNTAGL